MWNTLTCGSKSKMTKQQQKCRREQKCKNGKKTGRSHMKTGYLHMYILYMKIPLTDYCRQTPERKKSV